MVLRLNRLRSLVALGTLTVLLAVTACRGDDARSDGGSTDSSNAPAGVAPPVIDPDDGGTYAPTLDPSEFVTTIDNPYLPLAPGARWVYEGTADGEAERTEIVVTDERRDIMGISAVVVRDTVTGAGGVVEATFDWFAQDRDGNVWYLGEDSKEYEDGKVVSTAGSWEAGVDGARPGIVMPADPSVGDAYRQEYYAGEAEDLAEVISVGGTAEVGGKTFTAVMVTKEWTPLEADVVEEKSYAPGVGMVAEQVVEGGEGRAELVEHTPGG